MTTNKPGSSRPWRRAGVTAVGAPSHKDAYGDTVAEEHLYTVSGASASPAKRISLTEAGLLERQHLHEWVLAHPEILGEDVLVVAFEFDRWMTGGGSLTWERLDVLAN